MGFGKTTAESAASAGSAPAPAGAPASDARALSSAMRFAARFLAFLPPPRQSALLRPTAGPGGYDLRRMRGFCVLLLLISGCRSTRPEGGEVSRPECVELMRHVQKLESEDTGCLRLRL